MSHEPTPHSQNAPVSGHSANVANEGEGNKTAARRYNSATEKYVKDGNVDRAAEAAKEALEGAEGAELEQAEEKAKSKATPIAREADKKGLDGEREGPSS